MNSGAYDVFTDFCFQDLFDAQVDASPDAIAVIYEQERLTYRELCRRADQLACHLQKLGVTADAPVGICVNRSIEMVVAILGVLKAGGAFIPLDPSYPRERLAFILDDANAQIVVTQAALLDVLGTHASRIVCLDQDRREIARQHDSSPKQIASAENLAYVIYTSGSTGQPKGVMITHSNLCHFVRNAALALDVTRDDVYLQTASISYALSIRQLMVPLAHGATIVLATSEQARDPILLFDLIKRQQISLMDMVPSFWRTCLQRLMTLAPEERQHLMDNRLRRIVSVGEPLLSDIPRDWRCKLEHHAVLVNIFGQTETTGVVATFPIPELQNDSIETIPIGTSVPGTVLYILDADLQPVPAGIDGELYVSSPCLARGYHNRPELTAQKFIPNPFHDEGGARLYRTGDRARYRDDGCIEYLGRSDFQVKIRGQRLELGAVEAVLAEHSAVQACAVIAQGERADDKSLVAFIVPAPNHQVEISALRQFMGQRVPDYMVPSAFVCLEALPLTPNGKINRLALPDLASAKAKSLSGDSVLQSLRVDATSPQSPPAGFVAPRTETEKKIAKIWQDLFAADRISVNDNFFELGGHSLMAVTMLARIEKDLGVRLPLTTLIHHATIAQIAERIQLRDAATLTWSPIVPIRTEGNNPPFFGVHGQEGGVLFWRGLAAALPPDQPFYGIQAQGVDGLEPALACIYKMAALYLAGIRKVQPRGPYYLGGYSMGGEIAFEIAQQLVRMGECVQLLVLFDTPNPDRPIRPALCDKTAAMTSLPEPNSPLNHHASLRRKFSFHKKRFSEQDLRGKLGFLPHEVAYQTSALEVLSTARIYRSLHKRLPDSILLRYLRLSHTNALRSYVPVRYPGKVTLFRANSSLKKNPDDSPMGWKPLAGGGFNVIHFTATHDLFKTEYVAEVAKRLNECLKDARQE